MTFKYCPQELAGFLDLFRNLEKFYFVVSCTNRVTKEWFKRYRKKVEACHFRVDAVNRDGALEVEQYHDFKWDYMRILPNPTRNSLMRLGSTAGDIWSDVEACLSKTRGIYKSLQGDEIFITPLPIRRAVHFGLLMEWNRWSEDIL
ncbi:hypothetical protein UCRPA7_5996 [Phaeoacremonium minimum UCRPA7]|uniref:Uncharacterized protein n=1 Tax=Phaeoacremonium minimum (strain UCR-PA7) TaxID=1286976 RepID=R8BGJ2_PHAM7|nr:hypothetical protein UCRPA7_5996 [Phaeoacremonium minimum UCRPA7]EON98443.1 hypothetical protein UCRPA7_5996 [Phaeoacremonium minimum UCRPA7]